MAYLFEGAVVAGVPGDYNQNGVVDAADFVVWRKNEGTTNVLANDPIGGMIGAAQYSIWIAHFGEPAGSGSAAGANTSVPEPATLAMLMFAAAGWILHCLVSHSPATRRAWMQRRC